MARPLRIEYPGALYHVTSRGNEKKDIFRGIKDREKFLSYLSSAWERYGAVFHAYCLMSNHFHLMVETPLGNLSRIMKHLNGSYTTYFNLKHKRVGHLLQSRYKAILVQADTYAAELSRYIHLNPVRAKIVSSPEKYRWSSCNLYLEGKTPPWLSTSLVLGYFGREDEDRRRNYRNYLFEAIDKESRNPLANSVASTILGTDDFVRDIKEKYLEEKESDRDLPALRDLSRGPEVTEIKALSEDAFPENERLARMAGIYLCWRFSGAKLKEIGGLYGISESGVNRACRRFENMMERDDDLRESLRGLTEKIK
ncbi:MAG: REP-associated tyrosine transposase [Synergistales bacterium]|nr:REP-associated tyrosine transposase [Synergistales bacterium]MDN5335956.1 REP-associated tyrosine transposase [Synergistales bacterium]